jgi:hypothetical protein
VSHRPLVFVSGATIADYLLWNWSVNANHEVISLVAGLTLPPLALATLVLLMISSLRLIAGRARRRAARAAEAPRPVARRSRGAAPVRAPLEQVSASSKPTETRSRRIAA